MTFRLQIGENTQFFLLYLQCKTCLFYNSGDISVTNGTPPSYSGNPIGQEHAVTSSDQESSWSAQVEELPLEDDELDSHGQLYPRSRITREITGNLYGVRMQQAGQVYFFPTNGIEAKTGNKILVQFEQGQVLGEVVTIINADERVLSAAEMADGDVVGLATAQDIATHTENKILGAEAAAFCTTCIRQRQLDMMLVSVEVLHDRSKIIFFFTAPSRIDFRELVKDLVRNYRTRIELRQIGVRHEAQMVGGLGNCGMVCCCHKYLRKFAPVTIKMAKEQNLFLNPAKLSGMCGRLLCCLSFEQSNYEEFNRRCPKLGKRYQTTNGTFKIIRANMFNQSICGLSETNEEVELTLDDWEALSPKRCDPAQEHHHTDTKHDKNV